MMLMQLKMYQPQYQQQQQSGTAVLYTATGQPVAFAVDSQVCDSYKNRQSVACGVILIITGVLSIMFNAVAININEVVSFVGHGIWCGVLVGTV